MVIDTYIFICASVFHPNASGKSWMLRLGIICRTVSSKDKIFSYLYGQIIECESIQIRHLLTEGHKHSSVLFIKTAYFMASEVPLLQWAMGVIASKCSCFPDLTYSCCRLLSSSQAFINTRSWTFTFIVICIWSHAPLDQQLHFTGMSGFVDLADITVTY